MRYFTPWQRGAEIEEYYLEDIVADITNQHTVPFGDAVIRTKETTIGSFWHCTSIPL
jgi:NAD+ synthase (glutamine-hydrolysing)